MRVGRKGKFITAGILVGIIAWVIISNLPPNQSAIEKELQTIVNKSEIKPFVQELSVEVDDKIGKTYPVKFKLQLKNGFMKLENKKQFYDMLYLSKAFATIKHPACSKCDYEEIDAENGDTLFVIDVFDDVESNSLYIYDKTNLLKDPDLVWMGNLDTDKKQTTEPSTPVSNSSSKNKSLADFIEENAIPYKDNYWINGKGLPSNWGSH